MSISLDGASNETYVQYRRKGNFHKVIQNIKTINKYKERYNSRYPILRWQFIIFGHNEHEIPDARKMAKKLNMEFRPKLNMDENFSPTRNKKLVRKEGGFKVASRKEYYDKYKKVYNLICHQMWERPQINWDVNFSVAV